MKFLPDFTGYPSRYCILKIPPHQEGNSAMNGLNKKQLLADTKGFDLLLDNDAIRCHAMKLNADWSGTADYCLWCMFT